MNLILTKPTLTVIIGFAIADLAHPVERHLAKVKVASSSLVIRSIKSLIENTTVFSINLYGTIAKG